MCWVNKISINVRLVTIHKCLTKDFIVKGKAAITVCFFLVLYCTKAGNCKQKTLLYGSIQQEKKSYHIRKPRVQSKKVREKSRECHNHKPQPHPDPKRKRKPTNLNKHKPKKRTKSTKISSLFPKRGNRNTKRTEKHKNKMTHGKTYNKSPRRINHKSTKSKTNTGTTALERSVQTLFVPTLDTRQNCFNDNLTDTKYSLKT